MNLIQLTNEWRSHAESMQGWCGPKKAELLMEYAQKAVEMSMDKTKPFIFVEIGVFGGRSLLALCLAAREL